MLPRITEVLRRSTEVFSLAHMAENWGRRCQCMFADIHFTHQHSLLTSLVSKISLVLFVRLDLVYLIAAHQNNLTDFQNRKEIMKYLLDIFEGKDIRLIMDQDIGFMANADILFMYVCFIYAYSKSVCLCHMIQHVEFKLKLDPFLVSLKLLLLWILYHPEIYYVV